MGRDLAATRDAARALFTAADAQLGFSLSALCFQGPEELLTDTVNQQPALFVTSLAAWEVMQAQGWEPPAYVAGHSLGELSALTAAGSLTFADGLRLVRRRGELMKAAGEREPGGMAAILALDIPQTRSICAQAAAETGKPVQVANDNCPGQVVISGDNEALQRAMALAQAAKARKVVQLPITIAAHSALMASAAAEFATAVDAIPIQTPIIPVIGNVHARPLTTPDEIRAELKAQLTAAVAWTDSIQYLVQAGVTRFVETGPGDVLLGLVKRIERSAQRIKFSPDGAAPA